MKMSSFVYLLRKFVAISRPGRSNNLTSAKVAKLIQLNDIGHIQQALESGICVNISINVKGYIQNGSMLMVAATNGFISMLELLLNYKADINKRDDQGLRALHWAVKGATNGNEERQITIIKRLLSIQEIHVAAHDDDNKTALDIAQLLNFQKISALLTNALAIEKGCQKMALDSSRDLFDNYFDMN